MFKIVRKSTLDDYEAAIHSLNGQIEDHESEIEGLLAIRIVHIERLWDRHMEVRKLKKALKDANEENLELKAENKRLFDYHNKRIQKTFTDKNGVKRNLDGTFARKNGV